MSVQQLQDSLKSLRLFGMKQSLLKILETPDIRDLSFEDKLSILVDSETNERSQRKQERLLRAAKLKISTACVEDIDYRAERGLDRSYIQTLQMCDWVERNQFIIITGATGVGKTWLGCAFANQAIRFGHSVLYKRFSLLLEEFEIARRDGSLPKLRNQLSKAKLLIIDDWAMAPLTENNRQDLLELVEERSGKSALLFTSQLPVNKWHEYIAEPTIADAILDRVVHRAHKIEIYGESMRKQAALKAGGHHASL